VAEFTAFDHAMMRRALALAERGLCTTTPNPRVGCVVVRGERVIGEGWHEKAGQPHAEALALQGIDAAGATLYVTLEPCAHQGRTPPCIDLILSRKISRVVAAMKDPNREATGGGERLSAAGARFEYGLLEEEARELNIGFISRVTRGRPWVRLKVAATLDGRTALADGTSRWITGAEARRDGHRWRARACAILTGGGTVRSDDPQLTVREVETSRQPLRVIVDSRLETPPGARILPALVFSAREGKLPNAEVVALPNALGKVDLPAMLAELARRGINELHVEGGFRLNGSLVREGCVDEFLLYLNPSFLGDHAQGGALGMVELQPPASLDARTRLRVLSLERLGEDLRLLARPAQG
jgi:diaminohydroxyphosphoribosylaminopyrimidine deaminase / 5-amino-6-(5-phosphoribosylamino)uracil reductase